MYWDLQRGEHTAALKETQTASDVKPHRGTRTELVQNMKEYIPISNRFFLPHSIQISIPQGT
jgi:hypothetical protein